MARGRVLALTAGEGRVIDAQGHLDRWFFDGEERKRDRIFKIGDCFADIYLRNASNCGNVTSQDFFGINYYSGDLVHLSLANGFELHHRTDVKTSDLGWDLYPQGIYRLLKKTSEKYPSLPILITENGIADAKDALRPQFLKDHLTEVRHAITEGARVENYCHWSLLDNFEWAEGFTPRFGLYEVDYTNLSRRARPSALLFSEIVKHNGF